MLTGIRARMGGAGVMLALALTITMTAPASADTLFTGETGNVHANGSLYYHYDRCDSGGYCHIRVTEAVVQDDPRWCGDGWGGILRMRYRTRSSTQEQTRYLTQARDCDCFYGGKVEGSGYKDVWFEVCNWNPVTDEQYSCGRLHKFQ